MKKFLKNQSGNFAVMLSLVALPVMLTIGAAVDFSSANKKQSNLQSAVDTAILAVGQDFESMSKKEIRTKLKDYLKSNMDRSEYKLIDKIKINIDKVDNSLTVTADAKYDTSFMMLAGVKKIDYEATSQIKTASGGAEVALVLDTTGSMSVNGKIDALKSAATSFVDKMMIKDTGGSVQISVVPFAQYVNVGMSNRNASWLDVEDDSSTTDPNYCYMTQDVLSTSNCTTKTGTNSEGQTYTYQQCDRTYGEPYEVCGPRTSSSTWYGCVGSRKSPLNLEDRNYNKKVPGIMDTSCGSEILALTDKKSDVLASINGLSTSGSTYIPSGLTWGMRVLSSKLPFQGGVSKSQAKKKAIKKILILMTDGDNTTSAQLPDNPTHNGGDVTEANQWTTTACNNIKSEDVSIYTITFGTLLDETKTLIKGCATDTSQYFHAVTGDDLADVFSDIQADIMALHLSM